MKMVRLELPEVILLKPEIFSDHRGFFFESFNQTKFNGLVGENIQFVQDNHSYSQKNTLRGLHFQQAPHEQGKLIRVIRGKIFDVAVDIRKNSINFGKWTSAILSAENKCQLWIPPGFAHGFLALTNSEVAYKVTRFYHPSSDKTIAWNDPDIGINWPKIDSKQEWLLAEKDKKNHIFLKNI